MSSFAPMSITPPASPSSRGRGKQSPRHIPDAAVTLQLPNCRGFKSNTPYLQWFSGNFVNTLMNSYRDLPRFLRQQHPGTMVLPKRLDSLELANRRLSQVLLALPSSSERDLITIQPDFNSSLATFCYQLTECYLKGFLDEIATQIDLSLRYAGSLQSVASCYDANSSTLIHMHLELRYYLLAVTQWIRLQNSTKPWAKSDLLLLDLLKEVFSIDASFCICFSELKAVLLYVIASNNGQVVDQFFEFLKTTLKSNQMSEFFANLPNFSSFTFSSSTPAIDFQPFYSKCLQQLVANCFVQTNTNLGVAISALTQLFSLLQNPDDASLRSIWDFFASNLNRFWPPKTVQDLLLGADDAASSSESTNGDLIDYFRSISSLDENTSIDDNIINFPLISFMNLFLKTLAKLPSENEKRRIWRKLKGGLFKRFYEAGLRRLNDDGWINAAFMLVGAAFAASGHSNEDLVLIGEILQRISFNDLTQTGQLSVISSLFGLMKLSNSWTSEFHPGQCVRGYFNDLLNKFTQQSRRVAIHYFHSIEVALGNLDLAEQRFDPNFVELLNIPDIGKTLLTDFQSKSTINAEFIHKLMEVIGAILVGVRQLVSAAGDSQNLSSNSLEDNSHFSGNLLADANSPLCQLVANVNVSLYPIVKACELALSKNPDVSTDRFISLVRGFLLLSLDVAHLPISTSQLLKPRDILVGYTASSPQSSPRMGISFLADCLNNSRVATQLQQSQVLSSTQSLSHYFRLTLRLLIAAESTKNQSGLFPEMSTFQKFQEATFAYANLEPEIQQVQTSGSLNPLVLLDALTNLIVELGRLQTSETPLIIDSFLPLCEEAFKLGFDSLSQGLVKYLFRLAGSVLCYCTSQLFKPFRPSDCFLSRLMLIFFQRTTAARKHLPPSYVFSSLHKWMLPGVFLGIGRLVALQDNLAEDANLKRYLNDCLTESLSKGQNRPNYTLQTLECHPLVASGILGNLNASNKLEPALSPVKTGEDFTGLRKIILAKLVSDCLEANFASWQLAAALVELHLGTISKDAEPLLAVILPRCLDLVCSYEERRQDVNGYLDSMDRLLRSIGNLMTKFQLWESQPILDGVGVFVDRTATAHPKLTFSTIARFLVAFQRISSTTENAPSVRPFLLAIRTAVVRMELDYGNGDFVRPHFEAFESRFQHLN